MFSRKKILNCQGKKKRRYWGVLNIWHFWLGFVRFTPTQIQSKEPNRKSRQLVWDKRNATLAVPGLSLLSQHQHWSITTWKFIPPFKHQKSKVSCTYLKFKPSLAKLRLHTFILSFVVYVRVRFHAPRLIYSTIHVVLEDPPKNTAWILKSNIGHKISKTPLILN